MCSRRAGNRPARFGRYTSADSRRPSDARMPTSCSSSTPPSSSSTIEGSRSADGTCGLSLPEAAWADPACHRPRIGWALGSERGGSGLEVMAVAFKGWKAEALEFFEGLEADNSKKYWEAH